MAMSEAMEKGASLDARNGELVKLRYSVGLSFEEASGVLGIAVPAAKQWWACARAWFRVEMAGTGTKSPSGQRQHPDVGKFPPMRFPVRLRWIK